MLSTPQQQSNAQGNDGARGKPQSRNPKLAPPRSRGYSGHHLAGGPLRKMVPQAAKVAVQVTAGFVAVGRFLGETSLRHPAQWKRNVALDAGRVVGQNRGHCLHCGRPLEGFLAGDHFVQDQTERELVGPGIHLFARRLLGAHVIDRAHDHARFGVMERDRPIGVFAAYSPGFLSQAEVENLDAPLAGNHYVLRFQVAMSNVDRVCGRHAVRDLHADFYQPFNR